MNINDLQNNTTSGMRVRVSMAGGNNPSQFDIVFYDRLGENRDFFVSLDEMYFQDGYLFLGKRIEILDEELQRNYQFSAPSSITARGVETALGDFSSFIAECLMDILDEIEEREYHILRCYNAYCDQA